MIPIAKARLEEICAQYLNREPRLRPVSRILVDELEAGHANWSVGEVVPRFHPRDAKRSLAILRKLQAIFRVAA